MIQFALSYEIYAGLNLTNQPAISSSIRINDFSQTYTMNVTGLNDKTIYEIYITAENDWPEYNLRMNDDRIARLELKTLKRRSKILNQPLIINRASKYFLDQHKVRLKQACGQHSTLYLYSLMPCIIINSNLNDYA